MSKKRGIVLKTSPRRWYRGAEVPPVLIRRFARQLAERFHVSSREQGDFLNLLAKEGVGAQR